LTITYIPFTKKHEYVDAYKQSRRRDDDIAIVSCCFHVEFDEAPNKEGEQPVFTVKTALLAYGGMAVKVVTAPLTQAYLIGKEWKNEILPQAYEKLAEDLPLSAGAPGGMIEYRRSLTTSFFFKFFLQVLNALYSG
jgi:xanthine dehydrogenase/oxidase